MDYLGIVIAFITVMLLLSIVVMGLVQLTQSWRYAMKVKTHLRAGDDDDPPPPPPGGGYE